MAILRNTKNEAVLLNDVTIATSFRSRLQGLIGKKSMDGNEAMWFPKSNWIHTFFMSIPIDVIYLDKKMTVKKLQPKLQPGRLASPVFTAHSVIEAPSGFIEQSDICLGDTLYVGS